MEHRILDDSIWNEHGEMPMDSAARSSPPPVIENIQLPLPSHPTYLPRELLQDRRSVEDPRLTPVYEMMQEVKHAVDALQGLSFHSNVVVQVLQHLIRVAARPSYQSHQQRYTNQRRLRWQSLRAADPFARQMNQTTSWTARTGTGGSSVDVADRVQTRRSICRLS